MTHYQSSDEEMEFISAQRGQSGYLQIIQGNTKPIQSVIIQNSKIPS